MTEVMEFKISSFLNFLVNYLIFNRIASFFTINNNFFDKSGKWVFLKWLRTCITVYYVYVAYYGLFEIDFASIDHPSWRNLKTHWWKCVTVWNVVLQVRYFIMSVVIDSGAILNPEVYEKAKFWIILKNVQDYCFITLDIPFAIVACCGFWLMCVVNQPLFFPVEMNSWIPDWYNHAVHTIPAPLILLQMFLHFHKNPPLKKVIFGSSAHCIIYIFMISYTKWITGEWIYRVIDDMALDIPQLILLFSTIGYIIPLLIVSGFYLTNSYIWSSQRETIKNK